MNKTYETICKLVSTAMFGSAISYDKDIDWSDVFEEMKVQGIASIVGDILSDMPMSDEIKEKWKDYIFCQHMYWDKAISVQDEVCRVLDKIPYVILKGMSASIYYPNPKLRSMGDIDVLVEKDSFDTAIELIKKNNYVMLNEAWDRHYAYIKDGIEIEVHNSYATALTSMGKKTIEGQIASKLESAKEIDYKEHRWKQLDKSDNGLVMIYHIFQHFRYYGVGFRQIIDWMMFVNSSSDVDWNEFNMITKADGIYEFLCVITKMCSLYFGLQQQDCIAWMNDADKDTCEKMFDYVVSRGNFGRKMPNTGFWDQFALKNKIAGLIARLQLGGTIRWKAAEKHKVLRPFAWIYQGCRVIKIMVQRKEPLKSISRDIEESKKIIELYDKLDIPRFDARGEK